MDVTETKVSRFDVRCGNTVRELAEAINVVAVGARLIDCEIRHLSNATASAPDALISYLNLTFEYTHEEAS